jgi:hypothetical protein
VLTVAGIQESHTQLKAAEIFDLIVAAIDHTQEEDNPHTIFVHEHDEPFGVAITVKPTSDAIATYSDYLTALLCGDQSVTGPDTRNPELDIWYRTLAVRLGA